MILNDGHTAFFRSPASNHSMNVHLALVEYLRVFPNSVQPIVVAVEPDDRDILYTHQPVFDRTCCGLFRYLTYLTQELLPWVNQQYAIHPNPKKHGIIGASHGGLTAFSAAMLYPEQFGFAIAHSPSFWVGFESNGNDASPWVSGELAKLIKERFNERPDRLRPKIWLDWGMIRSGGFQNSFIEKYATLRSKEVVQFMVDQLSFKRGENLFWLQDPVGGHEEKSWAKRLPVALKSLEAF